MPELTDDEILEKAKRIERKRAVLADLGRMREIVANRSINAHVTVHTGVGEILQVKLPKQVALSLFNALEGLDGY